MRRWDRVRQWWWTQIVSANDTAPVSDRWLAERKRLDDQIAGHFDGVSWKRPYDDATDGAGTGVWNRYRELRRRA